MRAGRGFLWRFLLLLFCLASAAINTGNNLLYLVLSMMIAIAAISWFLSARSLARLDARPLLPDEVAAGRPFIAGLEARAAPGAWPAGWAEARLEGVPVEMPALAVPALPPGGRTVCSGSAVASSRGVHSQIALEIATTFPFGLFRRRRRIESGAGLVVTPRRRKIRRLTIETPAADGAARSPRPGDGADLFNIREYTPQDDARRIDWRASARLDRPMYKEFEREQERVLEIVLDERAAPGARPEAFEEQVSLAASILDHCAERGIHGRLVVPRDDGGVIVLSGRAAMTHLAAAEPRAGAPSPESAGPAAAGIPRIVLSDDPAARTRLHVEWGRSAP